MTDFVSRFSASLQLGVIAERTNTSKNLVEKILDEIIDAGIARPIADYLLKEEIRRASERLRRARR